MTSLLNYFPMGRKLSGDELHRKGDQVARILTNVSMTSRGIVNLDGKVALRRFCKVCQSRGTLHRRKVFSKSNDHIVSPFLLSDISPPNLIADGTAPFLICRLLAFLGIKNALCKRYAIPGYRKSKASPHA